MSDLVENPEDRFSHNEAQMIDSYQESELSKCDLNDVLKVCSVLMYMTYVNLTAHRLCVYCLESSSIMTMTDFDRL